MRVQSKVGTFLDWTLLTLRLVTGVLPEMTRYLIGIQINKITNAIALLEKRKNDDRAACFNQVLEVLRSATKKLPRTTNILAPTFHDRGYLQLAIIAAKTAKIWNSLVTLAVFLNIIVSLKTGRF